MRIALLPENFVERFARLAGLVPEPLLDTFQTIVFARVIMAATKLGVFEALAGGAASADDVAKRCATDPRATKSLLDAVVGTGYLRFDAGRYVLAPLARKWLLRSSPNSLYDNILWRYSEWEIIERAEDFVRTGKPLRVHEESPADRWEFYQRGMRSLSGLSAAEVARRTPVPRGATAMLDIGGSHGFYSVSLCRRHPNLRSTILDLPEAVKHAAPILAREGMGDRVVHRPGNALTEDLGEEVCDLVFVANLIHHFDAETNATFARRIARALRPGGIYVNLEILRRESPNEPGQTGALLNFFFALTSESGTWSFAEMAAWQRDAGLEAQRPIRLATLPGGGLQAGRKQG